LTIIEVIGLCNLQEDLQMPVLLVPILWASGAVVLLGGGYYLIAHVMH
jgi:hypothetical protein